MTSGDIGRARKWFWLTRRLDQFFEHGVGHRAPVGQQPLHLVRHDAEDRGVGPRLRDLEVDELEQGLDVLGRASAGQAFVGVADRAA